MMDAIDLLIREADEAAAKARATLETLASNPILPDPDAQVMAIAPAATCAGAVNLLEAVNARRDAA